MEGLNQEIEGLVLSGQPEGDMQWVGIWRLFSLVGCFGLVVKMALHDSEQNFGSNLLWMRFHTNFYGKQKGRNYLKR